MKLNLFEGFRRFNAIVVSLILIIGTIIAFNLSVSIEGETVYLKPNECVSTYTKYEHLDNGRVETLYCFDQDYPYQDMQQYAQNDAFTPAQISNYEDKLRNAKIWQVLKGIGFTLLVMILYRVICYAINYIASGFVQNQ